MRINYLIVKDKTEEKDKVLSSTLPGRTRKLMEVLSQDGQSPG
jgi:hypothetical protein